MTKRALINQAELLRMAKVAKELNVSVSVEHDGVIFRVMPLEGASEVQQHVPVDRPPYPIDPPFDHRETTIMEHLVRFGTETAIASNTIRSLGPSTQSKLEKRGYVAVTHAESKHFKDDEVRLTLAGLAAWKALEKYRSKYVFL